MHVFCTTELWSGGPLYIAPEFLYSPYYGWARSSALHRRHAWSPISHPLDLSSTVYASAAFPGVFRAARFRVGSPGTDGFARGLTTHPRPKWAVLADGGIYNNLATELYDDLKNSEANAVAKSGAARRLWSESWLKGQSTSLSPPSRVLVINASAPPTHLRKLGTGPVIGVLKEWRRVVTILYENTVRPRIALLESSGSSSRGPGPIPSRPNTLLVDISRSPLEDAAEIASKSLDGKAKERAKNVAADLRSIEHEDYYFWPDFVYETSRFKTKLTRVGPETAARIVQHGYLSALVQLHCLHGLGRAELLGEEYFLRLVTGNRSSGDPITEDGLGPEDSANTGPEESQVPDPGDPMEHGARDIKLHTDAGARKEEANTRRGA